MDNDGIADVFDPDIDGDNDGIADISDALPSDTDNDGVPNLTDTDDDNDGVSDSDEALIATNPLLADSDSDRTEDGLGDFDGDGLSNAEESDESLSTVTDADADGKPDVTRLISLILILQQGYPIYTCVQSKFCI